MGWPILSTLTFLPTLEALLILVLPRALADRLARPISLIATVIVMLLSFLLWAEFDPTSSAFQFLEQRSWLAGGITYKMGVDGISILFVVLTAFLMPFCILASWESIEDRIVEYMVAFLVLETLMIGVFCALDLLVF